MTLKPYDRAVDFFSISEYNKYVYHKNVRDVIRRRKMDAIISACGDNCTVCPRFLPKSKAELERTAELWYKIGYRDKILSVEEISCTGCKAENPCRYGIVKCTDAKKLKSCGECGGYPCGKILGAIEGTASFEPKIREVCTADEYAVMIKAYFEKQRNLDEINGRNKKEIGL